MRARQGDHRSSMNVNSPIFSSQKRTIAAHCQVYKRGMFEIAPKTPLFARLSKHRNHRSRCFPYIRTLHHSRFITDLACILWQHDYSSPMCRTRTVGRTCNQGYLRNKNLTLCIRDFKLTFLNDPGMCAHQPQC